MRQQLAPTPSRSRLRSGWSQPQSSRCSMASSRWFCTCQRRSRRPAGERSAFQIISLARSSPAASGSDKDRLTLRRRWPAGWMPVMHALSPYKALMPLWATSGTSFWRSSCARAWPCSMMMAEKRGVMKDVAS